jgi:hypothetical protein
MSKQSVCKEQSYESVFKRSSTSKSYEEDIAVGSQCE